MLTHFEKSLAHLLKGRKVGSLTHLVNGRKVGSLTHLVKGRKVGSLTLPGERVEGGKAGLTW